MNSVKSETVKHPKYHNNLTSVTSFTASHGVVYLQQFYLEPLNKHNTEKLRDRPNDIEFHTQNPYLESIGEPYVYSLDFTNHLEFKSVLLKILARAVHEP